MLRDFQVFHRPTESLLRSMTVLEVQQPWKLLTTTFCVRNALFDFRFCLVQVRQKNENDKTVLADVLALIQTK